MRKIFLSFVLVLATTMSVFADGRQKYEPSGNPIYDGGEYVLFNVAASAFLYGNGSDIVCLSRTEVAYLNIYENESTYQFGNMSPVAADEIYISGSGEGNDQFTIEGLGDNQFRIGNTKFPDMYLSWSGDEEDMVLKFTDNGENDVWVALVQEQIDEYNYDYRDGNLQYFAAIPLKQLLDEAEELGIDCSDEKATYENMYSTIEQLQEAIARLRQKLEPYGPHTITYPEASDFGWWDVKSSAKPGDLVFVTAYPAEGYHVASFVVNGGDVSVEKISDTEFAFYMPATTVIIEATFASNTVAINLPSGDEYIITASATTAVIGSTFTMTVEPKPGYTIESVTASGVDPEQVVSVEDHQNGTYSFAVPEFDVYVTVSVSSGTIIYDWATETGWTDLVDVEESEVEIEGESTPCIALDGDFEYNTMYLEAISTSRYNFKAGDIINWKACINTEEPSEGKFVIYNSDFELIYESGALNNTFDGETEATFGSFTLTEPTNSLIIAHAENPDWDQPIVYITGLTIIRYVPSYEVRYFDGEVEYENLMEKVIEGEYATRPNVNPTKEGFTFSGWREEYSSENFDFDNTEITENINLYAAWVSTPTGLENAEAMIDAEKVLRDGQLLIRKNGNLYNAQGVVVE